MLMPSDFFPRSFAVVLLVIYGVIALIISLVIWWVFNKLSKKNISYWYFLLGLIFIIFFACIFFYVSSSIRID